MVPEPVIIDATSSVVWLLGHPVGHSLSPLMQNAAFKYRGLEIRYVARDVEPDGLQEAVAEIRSPRVCGANLTVPHKETVIPLLDELDKDAGQIGAVNTVVNRSGRLTGHNTDLEGFLRALQTVLPEGPRGLDCLVLGAGGAARAVLAGLMREGAARVWIANRTQARADALCAAATAWGGGKCVVVSPAEVPSIAGGCALIVNSTSLGLSDSVKDFPLDVDTLHSGQTLLDLVYGTAPTALVGAAKARGLLAIDGKEMLIQQAALSYQLWTGLTAPLEVMRGSIIGGKS